MACAIALAFFSLGVTAHGQGADRSRAALAARAAARAANFEVGLSRIIEGNLAAAEAALFRDNVEKPGSIGWSIESAQRMAYAATVLRERNDLPSANLAAERAIEILGEAEEKHSKSASAPRRAQMYEVAGRIYERLLLAPEAAQSAFLKAQQARPGSRGAEAGLERIEKEAKQRTRLPGGKG